LQSSKSTIHLSWPVLLRHLGIAYDPMFAWWVPHTLTRRNAILSAVNARVRKKIHNYGMAVPTGLVQAKELDRINGNTLWMDALKLEWHNAGVAFEILEDGKSAPQGWTKASGHIIWDLKWTSLGRQDEFRMVTSCLRINICWCCFQGKCVNSTDLCCAKLTGSMCCGLQECLPASAFLL
jgi:hypothetical protein